MSKFARNDGPVGSDAKALSQGTFVALRVRDGQPLPLGVHPRQDGFNFAIFSRNAESVTILVFNDIAAPEPVLVAELDPAHHRTGDIWHALICGMSWGYAYVLRVAGPCAPEQGHRFDSTKLLLDPYAYAVSRVPAKPMERTVDAAELAHERLRCLVVDRHFDWQGTNRPKRSWTETVIYETHVRGLTIDPSAGVDHPGSFLGLIQKIGYLVDLGVTALELMPVQTFDEANSSAHDPDTGQTLPNYWGYDTIGFMSPHEAYSSDERSGSQVAEFKTMVRALHRAGIEVILDVVFNHTAEGNETGPTFNFRGLDNAIYYMLDADTGHYKDFSGCGNTLNCNHPVVRDYIIDCLRYWVTEMHVDGFRFDLASILGRDETGHLASNPPLLERIAEDPILRDVKLIAEAWDMGGAYQVGSFPGLRWAEWNGRFRDDVRRFWRGDPGMTGALATRICGSADLYQHGGKEPVNSINFITCHDGFTLADLVSYADKHNHSNGAGNQDGPVENYGANYGFEGPTRDETIEATRLRQIKNMLGTLFLSRGVPMMLGGDEFGRTQRGNNNAYCQDNEVSWYDWGLLAAKPGLHRFVRLLIALRKHHPALTADSFYSNEEIKWFGPSGGLPDWNAQKNMLGCLINPSRPGTAPVQEAGIVMLFNAGESGVEFRLPNAPKSLWRLALDTTARSPNDIFWAGEEPEVSDQGHYRLGSRSLVVLVST